MQNKTLQSVCYIAVEQLLYHTFSQIHVIRSTLEISGSTKGKMGSLSHCRAQSRDPVASSWPREFMKMYLILFQLKDRAKKAWPLWPVCLRYNRGPPCSVPRLSTPAPIQPELAKGGHSQKDKYRMVLSTHTSYLLWANSQADSRQSGAGGRGTGAIPEWLRSSVEGNEKVLAIGSGNACTTLEI